MASNDYADVIFNELDNIDSRPQSDFACGDQFSDEAPFLWVQGVGPLTLPLSAEQAEAFAAMAAQVPVGHPLVQRSVLQLDPAQLTIQDEEWDEKLADAVEAAREVLALPDSSLQAELDKVLLYRPGDSFLPHNDIEKRPGMVATLVVQLPSQYEGGQLLVRHGGQERSFFGGSHPTAAHDCKFAAFYADCTYERHAVTSGHQFVFIYHLFHVGEGPPPVVPEAAGVTRMEALRGAVQRWLEDAAGPEKLCLMLDQNCTERGIAAGLQALQGTNRAAGQALHLLASHGLLDVHLAVLEKHETGLADDDGDCYGYDGWGKRRRCGYSDEDDECGGSHKMAEEEAVRHSADKWVTLQGQRRDFGPMHVEEVREVRPCDGFEGMEADDEEFDGYKGHACATVERRYRRAAWIIWPRHRRAHILATCNINGAISQLAADLAAGDPAEQCATFAVGIVGHLEAGGSAGGSNIGVYQRSTMVKCSTSFKREPTADSLTMLMGCIADMAEAQAAAGQAAGGNAVPGGGAAGAGSGVAEAGSAALEAGASAAAEAAAAEAAAAAAAGAAGAGGGAGDSDSSPASLARRCLEGVLPGRLSGSQHAAALFRMGRAVGWAPLQGPLMALLRDALATPYKVGNAVGLLYGMAQQLQQWRQQEQAYSQLAATAVPAAAAAQAAPSGFEAAVNCMMAACQLAVAAATSLQGSVNVSHPATWRGAAPSMLETLAVLGSPELLPLVQQLLPLLMERHSPDGNRVLVHLQQRFGWEAIRPAAQRLASQCEADSSHLPRCMALMRQLAEVAVAAAGTPEQAQQVAAAAAGKENAGAVQPLSAAPLAAAKWAETVQKALDVQYQLAGLLAAVLDIALKEADAAHPRTPQFVVDAFAAVHALLPEVGLAPCRPATVAGMPLTGLADRLALLSVRMGQLQRRYPALECLHPACIQLHTLLGEQACPALLALTRHTAASIKALSKPLLAPQKDWSIGRTLACTCNDCGAVQTFLTNPTQSACQFPLPVKRNKHVSSSLNRHARGFVQHQVLRTGSPYKLAVTKTQLFWQRRQEEGKALAAKAAQLQKLLPKAAAWEGAAAAAAALAGV